MSLNLRTLAYGIGLAILDVVSFPMVKGVSLGWSTAWMAVPIAVYSMAPVLLLSALKAETLVVMNLVWDLLSDVIITMFVFSERIAPLKVLGVCLCLVSLFLLNYENDGWNGKLLEFFHSATGFKK